MKKYEEDNEGDSPSPTTHCNVSATTTIKNATLQREFDNLLVENQRLREKLSKSIRAETYQGVDPTDKKVTKLQLAQALTWTRKENVLLANMNNQQTVEFGQTNTSLKQCQELLKTKAATAPPTTTAAQASEASGAVVSSTLWKDRLLRWDNRRTIPPINNFPSAPRIEVACLINDMAYSSYEVSYGTNDGVRSQMDACSFLLPRFGIHTHTIYLEKTRHAINWRIPSKIVSPCPSCSVHKSIASVPEEVSNKVEYVVMAIWKLDQLNRKQLENTLAKMKNSKLVLLVDGTEGADQECKLGEPAEPIQYLKNLAQNKRLAFVTLGNDVAAQRLFRYQLGVPISTLNFNGEECTLSQWAGGVSRGVLILGRSGVPSDPKLICNIAQQLGSTYKIMLSSARYKQVECKNLPHLDNDDGPHVVKGVATLGNMPFIHNEAAVSLVFNSCPFDRMNGVAQTKIQTMLKLGLKVAVEEGEPGALHVVDLRAGEIIPRGSKANVWTAAIQRLSSSMTVQEKNRIRMEAHILFSADNTASHLAQKLFADKFA
tara:strand:+ start:63 stop:1694 length:1632 start_codon:yes stop_codon:yes gene_type:complete